MSPLSDTLIILPSSGVFLGEVTAAGFVGFSIFANMRIIQYCLEHYIRLFRQKSFNLFSCVFAFIAGSAIIYTVAHPKNHQPTHPPTSVGYRTGNHYRLSEYTGRLIIDCTIENYIHFTENSNFHKTNL